MFPQDKAVAQSQAGLNFEADRSDWVRGSDIC